MMSGKPNNSSYQENFLLTIYEEMYKINDKNILVMLKTNSKHVFHHRPTSSCKLGGSMNNTFL